MDLVRFPEMADGDQQPETIVAAEVVETLQWCLRVHTRMDEAEAALSLHTVAEYSPLTHSIAEALHTLMEYQPLSLWPPGAQDKVAQVLASYVDSPHPHRPG